MCHHFQWTVLVALTITIGAHGASVQGGGLVNVMERIVKTIRGKCVQKDARTDEVLDELSSFILCRESLIAKNLTAPQEDLTKYCHAHIPHVVTCLKKFVDKLELCLVEEESYLRQFLFDAYQKYAEYACDNLNVLITDVLKTNTVKCLTKFFQEPDKDPHKVCYGKSKVFGDDANLQTITKTDLCHDLYDVRACQGDLFEKYCPDAPEIKEFELGIMRDGLAPCSDVMENDIERITTPNS